MTLVPLPADATLRGLYDDLWRDGRRALLAGAPHVDPPPVDGGPRWGISAVLRPHAWPADLAHCASQVATMIGPPGFVYEARNLHVTLRQFEPYRATVPHDDARVRDYAGVLRALARETPPLSMTLQGLTASPGGVLLQGWPGFDLPALRSRLQRLLERHAVPLTGPETSQATLRSSAHATLSIFGERIERPDNLAAHVDAHRATFFETIVCDELWLVGYERTATAVTLIDYGRFPLGERAGSSR